MAYKVKELRKKRGMTQEELEQKSGVSRVTISSLENGTERNTTTETLLKLATALDTTIDQIFYVESV